MCTDAAWPAKYLTVEVTGSSRHIVLTNGPECADRAVRAYLTDGKLPKRKAGRVADVTCKALPAPEPVRSPTG